MLTVELLYVIVNTELPNSAIKSVYIICLT